MIKFPGKAVLGRGNNRIFGFWSDHSNGVERSAAWAF